MIVDWPAEKKKDRKVIDSDLDQPGKEIDTTEASKGLGPGRKEESFVGREWGNGECRRCRVSHVST